MLDQRKEQRWPAFLRGMISYKSKLRSVECIVKNTSGTGAKISARDLPTIPDQFDLSIPRQNAEYRVRLKWRRNGEIGVSIEDSYSLDADKIAQDRRLKRLERETDLLRRQVAPLD